MPKGRTCANRATSSAHAPAALMMIFAVQFRLPAAICHAPFRQFAACRRLLQNSAVPCRLAWRKYAAWSAATSMSQQSGSQRPCVQSLRSPGTRASTAARSLTSICTPLAANSVSILSAIGVCSNVPMCSAPRLCINGPSWKSAGGLARNGPEAVVSG